jgi:hypothetical protein
LGGWLFGHAVYARPPEQAEHASLSLCCAMRMELGAPFWLAARGTSMLPWRLPGCELKLDPLEFEPEKGLILVFRHGRKLCYHRVMERIGRNQWRTKGDTLIDPDAPVSDDDIVGRITAVRRGNRVREVRPDRSAAWLSHQLGSFFAGLGQPSGHRRRLGLRIAYLAILLSAWPFRRVLAREDREAGAAAGAKPMGAD